jgi:hypothetical protein
MPDMQALMRQAQQMQAKVAKAQEEVLALTADGASGGGMVNVTVNGAFDVTKIKIEKDVVDPSDIGMLEDLVMSAVNAANARMRELQKAHMNKAMGGMNIPGMPGLF